MALDPRVLERYRQGRDFARYSREAMSGGQSPITAPIPTGSPGTAPTSTATQPEARFGSLGGGALHAGSGALDALSADPAWSVTLRRPEPDPQPQDWGSVRRGLARLKQGAALLMQDQGWASTEDTVAYILDQAEVIRQNPMPEESAELLDMLSSAKSAGDFIGAMVMNAGDVPGAFMSVLGESAVQAGATIAGGVAGGVAGSAAGPVGTIGGASAGGALGSYMTTLPVEVMGAWTDAAEDAGYDIRSIDGLREAMGDEEVIARAKVYANRRSIPIAVFDGVSVGFAGRVGGPVSRILGRGSPGIRARIGGLGAELGLQAGAGAAGEAGAQLASEGRIVSGGDIALEGAVEFFFGVPEMAVGAVGARGVDPNARVTEEDEGDVGEPPAPPAPPDLPRLGGPEPMLALPPPSPRPSREDELAWRRQAEQTAATRGLPRPPIYAGEAGRQSELFNTTTLGRPPTYTPTGDPRMGRYSMPRDEPTVSSAQQQQEEFLLPEATIAGGEMFSLDETPRGAVPEAVTARSALAQTVQDIVDNVYIPTREEMTEVARTDPAQAETFDRMMRGRIRQLRTVLDNLDLSGGPISRQQAQTRQQAMALMEDMQAVVLSDPGVAAPDQRPRGPQERTGRQRGEGPLAPLTTQGLTGLDRIRQAIQARDLRRRAEAEGTTEAQDTARVLQGYAEDVAEGAQQAPLQRANQVRLPQDQARLRFEEGEKERARRNRERLQRRSGLDVIEDTQGTAAVLNRVSREGRTDIMDGMVQSLSDMVAELNTEFENTARGDVDADYRQRYGDVLRRVAEFSEAIGALRTDPNPRAASRAAARANTMRRALERLEEPGAPRSPRMRTTETLLNALKKSPRAVEAAVRDLQRVVGSGRAEQEGIAETLPPPGYEPTVAGPRSGDLQSRAATPRALLDEGELATEQEDANLREEELAEAEGKRTRTEDKDTADLLASRAARREARTRDKDLEARQDIVGVNPLIAEQAERAGEQPLLGTLTNQQFDKLSGPALFYYADRYGGLGFDPKARLPNPGEVRKRLQPIHRRERLRLKLAGKPDKKTLAVRRSIMDRARALQIANLETRPFAEIATEVAKRERGQEAQFTGYERPDDAFKRKAKTRPQKPSNIGVRESGATGLIVPRERLSGFEPIESIETARHLVPGSTVMVLRRLGKKTRWRPGIVEKINIGVGDNVIGARVMVETPNGGTRTITVDIADIARPRSDDSPNLVREGWRGLARNPVGQEGDADVRFRNDFLGAGREADVGRVSTTGEALEWVAKHGPQRYRALARGLQRLLPSMTVRIGTAAEISAMTGQPLTGGAYDPRTQTIYISTDTPGPVHTLMHEAVHAATMSSLLDEVNVQAIRDLMARARAAGIEGYGLTDEVEFLAEAFTNPEFQDALAQVPAPDRTTLWGRLLDFVRRLMSRVGVPARRSLLDEVVRVSRPMFVDEATTRQTEREVVKSDLLRQEARLAQLVGDAAVPASAAGGLHSVLMRPSGGWARQKLESLRGAMLGALTLDQIIDRYGHHFGKDGGALGRYQRLMGRKTAQVHKYQNDGLDIERPWANFQAKDGAKGHKLHQLMMNTTLLEYDVDPQRAAQYAKKKISAKDKAALQKLWKEIGPEGQKIYRDVRDFFEQDWKDVTEFLKTNVLIAYGFEPAEAVFVADSLKSAKDVDSLNLPESRKGEDVNKWRHDLMQAVAPAFSRSKTAGPYFPLRRFGRYVLQATTKQRSAENLTQDQLLELRGDASVEVLEQNPDPVTGRYNVLYRKRYVGFFENRGEAEDWRRHLISTGDYDNVGNVDIRREDQGKNAVAPHALIEALKGKLDERTLHTLNQILIEWMPDTSFKKAELHRKKVLGADMDMRRGFAQYLRSGSYYKAQLQFGRRLGEAVREISEAADADQSSSTAMRQVENEIKKRDGQDMTFLSDPSWVSTLSDIGYAWYLISPSYWFVNMTQPALVTAPYLAARYGGGRSLRHLNRAYRSLMPYMVKTTLGQQFGVKQLRDRLKTNVASDDMFRIAEDARQQIVKSYGAKYPGIDNMLTTMTNQGLIDLTFAMDLRDLVEYGAEGRNRVWAGIMEAGRLMPHAVEVLNRITTATAAYTLEIEKSGNDRQAVQAAADAISKTQFNYGAENKPRYMTSRGFLGFATRPVLMFKQYAQHMYYLLGSSIEAATRGKDKETRRVGRNTFLGILASHALAAGAAGALFEPIKWAFGLAQVLFEDEDEPWQLDQVFESALADMTGSPRLADAIMGGLPRLAGVDLSNRVGIDNLLFFDVYGQSPEQEAQAILAQAFGPLGAIFMNTYVGWDKIAGGDVMGGVTQAMPKGIRDGLKAFTLATEGLTDRSGNTIIDTSDMSPWDYFVQSMGFSPARVAATYEYRQAVNERFYGVSNTRDELLRRFRQEDDRTAVLRDIQEFNRRHPRERITADNIRRSLTAGLEREARTRMVGGVYLPDDALYHASGLNRPY